MSAEALDGLCFDIFLHERGMPYYDVAKWFQWDAAHYVDPKTWEPLVCDREARRAVEIIHFKFKEAMRDARRQSTPSVQTLYI